MQAQGSAAPGYGVRGIPSLRTVPSWVSKMSESGQGHEVRTTDACQGTSRVSPWKVSFSPGPPSLRVTPRPTHRCHRSFAAAGLPWPKKDRLPRRLFSTDTRNAGPHPRA